VLRAGDAFLFMPNKVLLINPPAFLDRSLDFEVGVPVHLAYVAGIMERIDWDVEILDMMLEEKEGFDSFADLRRRLKDETIRLVGISDHTMRTFVTTRAVSDTVKSKRPDVKVLVGGVNATFMWRELLDSCPSIDYIFRGYANKAINLLLEAIVNSTEPKAPGLVSRTSYLYDEMNVVWPITSKDFSSPDLRLLSIDRYLSWTRSYPLLTQTGCNFSCNFCTSIMPSTIQKKEFLRPIDDIIVEMGNALELGFDQFFMSANTFTSSKQFCNELCRTIITNGFSNKASWVCMTRVELIDSQLLSIMKRAGCKNISYGVESSGVDQWRKLNKGLWNKKTVKRAFNLTKKAGIETTAYIMVGAPEQRNNDVEGMIGLLRDIDPEYRVLSFFQPFPGTPYWNNLEYYMLSEIEPFENWNFQETPACRTKHFSKSDLIESATRIYLEVGQYATSDIQHGVVERGAFFEASPETYPDAILDVIDCIDRHMTAGEILTEITERHGYRGRIIALYYLSYSLRNNKIRVSLPRTTKTGDNTCGLHSTHGVRQESKGEYAIV
jgi:radical SAM superfamily enzyme YgiQ (UPF0313 family)